MNRLHAIAFLLGATLAGCRGPAAPPPSSLAPQVAPSTPSTKVASDPAEIMGTWQGTFGGGPAFLIFGEAGNLTVAQSQDGSAGAAGQYFFEGTRLALRTDLPFPGCDTGSTAYYEARLDQQDGVTTALRFTLMDDPCVERMNSLVNETAAWVRP